MMTISEKAPTDQRRAVMTPRARAAWLGGFLVVQMLYFPINRCVQGGVILKTIRRLVDEITSVQEKEQIKNIGRYIKTLYLHNYMDEYSLDAEVLKKCACMQVLPERRMIPECAYRTLHRGSDLRWKI